VPDNSVFRRRGAGLGLLAVREEAFMRALSGAIITAAALIALGLTAQGIGTRYNGVMRWKTPSGEDTTSKDLQAVPDFQGAHVKIHHMDNGLILCLTLAGISLLIGLGITFLGLMYHHHRRYHEHLRIHGPAAKTSSHPVAP
jgi:hypothetical protein